MGRGAILKLFRLSQSASRKAPSFGTREKEPGCAHEKGAEQRKPRFVLIEWNSSDWPVPLSLYMSIVRAHWFRFAGCHWVPRVPLFVPVWHDLAIVTVVNH
jgi:hypothetical protein